MLNVNSLLSTILQGSIELPPSILNRMIIRIDYYDQSRFGFSPSATVVAYFVDKRFPHPTFGVPLARGRTLNPHFAVSHPALFEISADKHFVAVVFQNHDDIDPR